MKIKKSGEWVPTYDTKVKQNGTWEDCRNIFVKDAGEWKLSKRCVADIELKAAGYGDTDRSTYCKLDGVSLASGSRGVNIIVFKNDLTKYTIHKYDTHTNIPNAQAAATFLQGLNAGDLIALFTYDQPLSNSSGDPVVYSFNPELRTALLDFGADGTLIDSIPYRGSYLLLAHKFGHKYAEEVGVTNDTVNHIATATIKSNSLFGRMNGEDWTQYTQTRGSTTRGIETSHGLQNSPATYTFPNLNWDANLQVKNMFYNYEDMHDGQILVGNRLIFEMGNDNTGNTPDLIWDNVGDILKVISTSTKIYYVKKIYGGSPFNTPGTNSDDQAIWEVVDVEKTTRGGNSTTTNWYKLTK